MSQPAVRRTPREELDAADEDDHVELIDGELVREAMTSFEPEATRRAAGACPSRVGLRGSLDEPQQGLGGQAAGAAPARGSALLDCRSRGAAFDGPAASQRRLPHREHGGAR